MRRIGQAKVGIWAVTVVMGFAVEAFAGSQPQTTGQQSLGYFAGRWNCTGSVTPGSGNPIAHTGTLTFQPWQAWTISAWEPQDPNAGTWPPHGGHGPVVKPPHLPTLAPAQTSVVEFLSYDAVADAYVTFKLMGGGSYAELSSSGPDSAGQWTWSGALSNDGSGRAVSVRSVVDTSAADVFTTVSEVSADMGATWVPRGNARCEKATAE